jgi:hypothetical protein
MLNNQRVYIITYNLRVAPNTPETRGVKLVDREAK